MSLLVAAHRDALEEGHELGQRVSAVDPFVVNQPLGGLAMLLVDLVRRQNLGSVHDRGRQAVFDRLLQKDAVEHLSRPPG